MDELQVRLSAGAETAATPTGPNTVKRESVREEKRAKTNGEKHKNTKNTKTPDCPRSDHDKNIHCFLYFQRNVIFLHLDLCTH